MSNYTLQGRRQVVAYLETVYNSSNPNATAYANNWSAFLAFQGLPVIEVMYNGRSSSSTFQVFGRPNLKRFLQNLAENEFGTELRYNDGSHSYTFRFVAEDSLTNLDDFFD